jgi:hypothetical protein
MASVARTLPSHPPKADSSADVKYRPPAHALNHCSLNDPKRAREIFARDGVVVFKGVAGAAELAKGEKLFWDWLEETTAGRRVGLKRDLAATHKSSVWKELGYSNTGVMVGESVGQSEFMWHCRSIPAVSSAFAVIFDTPASELVTSFDGCGSWRNFWLHGGKGSVRSASVPMDPCDPVLDKAPSRARPQPAPRSIVFPMINVY